MSQNVIVPAGAWRIWGIGTAVYLLAVFHRSSLAVAGLAASDRFGISASQLATFVMLQLFVYAGMQIPVGLLVDRFGPRAILLAGTVTISVGQIAFALAESFATALGARVLVGIGDAMTFICVLRLVTTWFPARRIPLVTQLTGPVGQLGALIAASPMTWALKEHGWTVSYMSAAGLGLAFAVIVAVVIHDAPDERRMRGDRLSRTSIQQRLAASWKEPGTRLGFWIHFTTQFSSTGLGLLWGYPFFVRGEGTSEAVAGLLLSVMVVAVIISGPVLGWITGRSPWHRSTMSLTIIAAIVVIWTVVLTWPGHAPLPVLFALVVIVGIGGPASMIGFDLARTSNPSERVASATAIVNQAGFAASLVLVIAIGLILDWRTPGTSTAYTHEAFVWAMSFQYVLWAVGVTQLMRYRRRTRAALLAADPDVRSKMIGLA